MGNLTKRWKVALDFALYIQWDDTTLFLWLSNGKICVEHGTFHFRHLSTWQFVSLFGSWLSGVNPKLKKSSFVWHSAAVLDGVIK